MTSEERRLLARVKELEAEVAMLRRRLGGEDVAKKYTDAVRTNFIQNDEGLAMWFDQSGMSLHTFLAKYGHAIDTRISQALAVEHLNLSGHTTDDNDKKARGRGA